MAGSASYFSLTMVGGSDVYALYDTTSVTFIFISRKGLDMEQEGPPLFSLGTASILASSPFVVVLSGDVVVCCFSGDCFI